MRSKKVRLHIDGASRGNPGPSGIGVVITDTKGAVLKEFCKYIGETTNNVAEYNALIYGLDEALMLGSRDVVVFVDSELIAKQVLGEYRVKDSTLKLFFEKALHLLQSFKSFEIKHVARSENKRADKLANKAINLAGF